MMVKTSGEGVTASAPRRHEWKVEEVARARDVARDVAMARMKRAGVPIAMLATVFNMDRSTVRRRLAAIPKGALLDLN